MVLQRPITSQEAGTHLKLFSTFRVELGAVAMITIRRLKVAIEDQKCGREVQIIMEAQHE